MVAGNDPRLCQPYDHSMAGNGPRLLQDGSGHKPSLTVTRWRATALAYEMAGNGPRIRPHDGEQRRTYGHITAVRAPNHRKWHRDERDTRHGMIRRRE
jgi:hypothetical protein